MTTSTSTLSPFDSPVEVDYAALMLEAFDLVIVDECHRSIYGPWRASSALRDARIPA